MDQHVITHASDMLAPGLDFANQGNSAEYITSSKLVRWRAESGDRFSDVSKTIRFALSGVCWLQPGTIRFQATLTNKRGGAITPCAPPLAMFSSARLYLGGQVVETIDSLTALATIIDRLKSGERRLNESMENHPLTSSTDDARKALAQGRSRKLITDLPFGLLRGKQWLPLHLINSLIIELTLGAQSDAFAEADASFELSDVSLLGTCLHTDTTLTKQYKDHIDRGDILSMTYSSIVATRHIVSSSDFVINLSRSLSKLKQCYFAICALNEKPSRDHKQVVDASEVDNNTDVLQFQFQIDASKYPDNPCIGAAEAYLRLRQSIGHLHDHESISITPAAFMGSSAVFGIDFERCGNETAFSGVSVKGSVLTLDVKGSQASALAPQQVFVYQVYDGVVNLMSGGGVEVRE